MTEQKTLIDRKPIVYEGIFRMDELWAVFQRWIKSRNMMIVELRNEEKVTAHGKDLFIELAPYRKISDYLRKIIELEIYVRHLEDKVVKVDGRKQKYQHGEVDIRVTAIMESDWRSRWEGTGFYFLVRTMMDKFIRYDVIREAENETVRDCLDLQEEIKAYLNMTRFKVVGKDAEEGRMHEGVGGW